MVVRLSDWMDTRWSAAAWLDGHGGNFRIYKSTSAKMAAARRWVWASDAIRATVALGSLQPAYVATSASTPSRLLTQPTFAGGCGRLRPSATPW